MKGSVSTKTPMSSFGRITVPEDRGKKGKKEVTLREGMFNSLTPIL